MHHLLILKPGAKRLETTSETVGAGAVLAQAPDGSVWASDATAVRKLLPRPKAPPSGKIGSLETISVPNYATIFDHNGILWNANANVGLIYVPRPNGPLELQNKQPAAGGDIFTRKDGLTSGSPLSVAEDREGNIWVGTTNGLDRFRPKIVTLQMDVAGNSLNQTQAVAASTDGAIFAIGNASPRVLMAKGDVRTAIDLNGKSVGAMCPDGRGGLWMGSRGLAPITSAAVAWSFWGGLREPRAPGSATASKTRTARCGGRSVVMVCIAMTARAGR